MFQADGAGVDAMRLLMAVLAARFYASTKQPQQPHSLVDTQRLQIARFGSAD